GGFGGGSPREGPGRGAPRGGGGGGLGPPWGAPEPLGPDGGLGGGGLLAEQVGGEGGAGRGGHRPTVERHLAGGVADLGPEVVPVELGQPLPDDQPQPEEERELRVGQVAGEFGEGVREPVLEHVR